MRRVRRVRDAFGIKIKCRVSKRDVSVVVLDGLDQVEYRPGTSATTVRPFDRTATGVLAVSPVACGGLNSKGSRNTATSAIGSMNAIAANLKNWPE